jgi:hypothetical protein
VSVTRAWWIVAGGMIIGVPGRIAIHLIHFGPAGRHAARGAFYFGLAVAAVGVVQVARAATRQFR